jgi:hypothetical protein
MISYESCKWYVKLWRKRWYLYAIFLHIKNYINVELWIDYLLYQQLSDNEKKKLRISWREIKRHVELSKMYKFSSKYERED